MSRRSSREQVLGALRDQLLTVGVKRATFADVSRRTGMSRSTLYRHFPDVETGTGDLMTREFTALLRQVYAETESDRPGTGRRQLVEAAVEVVRRLPAHPLFRRVLDVDPELLLPYLTTRLGQTQRAGLELVASFVEKGQADGSVRGGDPQLVAYSLQLTVQPFVLSARVTAAEHDPEAVAAELRHLLDAYLRPEETEGECRRH